MSIVVCPCKSPFDLILEMLLDEMLAFHVHIKINCRNLLHAVHYQIDSPNSLVLSLLVKT